MLRTGRGNVQEMDRGGEVNSEGHYKTVKGDAGLILVFPLFLRVSWVAQ